MGPRIFTVPEANSLIPCIEAAFTELDSIRAKLRKVKGKMEVLEMLWGDEIAAESNPDSKEYRFYLDEIAKAKASYDATCKKLVDMEVVLKSADTGLIDFYGVIDSRLVFLCWKRGEKTVDFFHHLEDGYQGRKEIEAQNKR